MMLWLTNLTFIHHPKPLKASLPSYPIVSRANAFKKFKKSLSEFFSRLIVTAAEAEVLLIGPPVEGAPEDTVNHPLIDVLKEWLSSFSSSTFRSFRHTSTYIVLNIVKATAGLTVETRKAVDTTRKQRDAERKRAATGGSKARLNSLEERWKEEKEKEANLMEAIRDFIDRYVMSEVLSAFGLRMAHKYSLHALIPPLSVCINIATETPTNSSEPIAPKSWVTGSRRTPRSS